ncbi:MAG: hypothetical protein ACXWC8_03985 [Limisphaerales bacterium]
MFEHDGDIYRAVRPDHEAFYRGLFDKNIIQPLIEQGLIVETEFAPFKLEGYPLVLKHRRIPFVTYASEWPVPALKDAGIHQAKLNIELARHGLGCVDAHPWNILFDGPNPSFIDIGSIAPITKENQSFARTEFDSRYVYPLRLMSQGQRRIARWSLRDFSPMTKEEINFLLPRYSDVTGKIGRRLSAAARSIGRSSKGNDAVRAMWEDTLQKVESIKLPLHTSMWSKYHADYPPFDERAKWKQKQTVIADALEKFRPTSLVDVGSNIGWYSMLAASRGIRVAACDMDEPTLDRLYLGAKERKLPVTSLYLNIRFPQGAHGWSGTRFPSVMERLRSDCVLALALLHHLVFFNHADFDIIVDALCQLTRKHLITEFISPEDKFVSQWWNKKFDWYTLPNLMARLKKSFATVEALPSNIPHRTIIVCSGLRS